MAWIDLKKVYYSIHQDLIWTFLTINNAGYQIIDLLKSIYSEHKVVVETKQRQKEILVERGILQGDPLSPTLANIALESVIRSIDMKATA